MSRSDIDVAKAATEAFGRDGVEALLPLIHPEFETTTPAGLAAEPDTYRGHEGIRRYFDSFYEAMDKVWLEADDFREVGGKVMVPGRLGSRGRSTGLESHIEAVFVWTVKDEKVIRAEVFPTEEEALAALEGAQPSAD
jgi:ketosteroid isomerase-like protein